MNKKTSIIALVLLITVAVILGFMFINRGDGPVMGMIISDKPITDLQDFEQAKGSQDGGLYVVLVKEFNRFSEKTKVGIPAGKDIYANIHFVEAPKGSKFTAKWIVEGKTIKEETKELSTDRRGIVPYKLEGANLKSGSCTLEIYNDGTKIFEYGLSVE